MSNRNIQNERRREENMYRALSVDIRSFDWHAKQTN